MTASVASTALPVTSGLIDLRYQVETHLFKVIMSKSPSSLPRYRDICSPPQSSIPSIGIMAKKQTTTHVKIA